MATRPTVPALDELIQQEIKVLDHGFIRLIDYMGDDTAIVQAARVSYGAGTKKLKEDKALIRYLRKHDHTTPFEMAEIKMHLRMPLFVMRQWIRHRTASVNEYSARYSVVKDTFYIPEVDQLAPQSKVNKQGREGTLTDRQKKLIRAIVSGVSRDGYNTYTGLLGEKKAKLSQMEENGMVPASELEQLMNDDDYEGISRELARICLPTNVYTECYWKIDLHNLLHFLRLRMDSHAQYEIRVFAQAIYDQLIKVWVPQTCEAFEDCIINAKKFTKQQYEVIKHIMSLAPVKEMLTDGPDNKFNEKLHKLLMEKFNIGNRELTEVLHQLKEDLL